MKRVLAIMSICACLCGGAALADVQRSNRLVVDVYPFDSDKGFADDSLQGWLRALEKHGFASVAGAQYVSATFRHFWELGISRDADLPITDFPSGEYRMTGNGWIRMAADGKYDVLAFDSAWWPNDSMKVEVVLNKARLSRDIAKMRACLRDAVECPDATSWGQVKHDRAALAFALHVHQAGHVEEAQALVDELKRRPDAAYAAFTSLLSMVRNAKKNYPDFKSWQENPHALGADAASAPAAPGGETPRREAEVPGQAAGNELATDVCPLSPVAVAGEGRGIVGHVCDAPLTLVEAEALEFIENEFLRHGVKLKAQIDAFFDYLAKRGKLPGQAHALDAAYNPGAGKHGSWYNCRVHNKGVSP